MNNTCVLATQGTCIDDATTNGTQSMGERCVDNVVICNVDADCGANGPCLHPTGNNREGVNNCEFEGQDGGVGAHAPGRRNRTASRPRRTTTSRTATAAAMTA